VSTGKFWVIFTDPEQPLSKAIDPVIKRSHNKFGIFVDWDSPKGKEYLQEVRLNTHPQKTPDQCPKLSLLIHLTPAKNFFHPGTKYAELLKLCMATDD
jgi:hypothetical protein